MRRADREMNAAFGMEVIDRSVYGTLSILDLEGVVYSVPLSIVRDGDVLYFHSAKSGKKVDIFKQNSKACISFVGNVNVPELFTEKELDKFKDDASSGVTLISSVFTTEFESAIVYGNVAIVTDKCVVKKALELICQKYTPTKMNLFTMALESGFDKVNIYSLKIDSISAKRKKYGSDRTELKWGRTE